MADDAADKADEAPEPEKKRKARGPKSKSEAPRRPTFAASFPRDPELDALVDAFVAGDYARVREQAPKLADKADDPAVRDAAKTLRARLDPDPAAKLLLLVTAVLLVVLTLFYAGRKPPPEPPPEKPMIEYVK